MTSMFQKHFNPVQAVKYYLLFSGMEVDEGSFESVEKTLGPFDIPRGYYAHIVGRCATHLQTVRVRYRNGKGHYPLYDTGAMD